jgi:hypothetical protein
MKALGLEGGLGGAVGCAGGRLRWERGGGGLLGNEAHQVGSVCAAPNSQFSMREPKKKFSNFDS